jgi:RHS repeat-associated protein
VARPSRASSTATRQTDSNPAKAYDLDHDAVNQLTTATLKTTDPTPVVLKRYGYGYDKTVNRTGEQIDDASTSATINSLNAITALQPGGALRFAGTVNEAATVTVQGKPAQVTASNQFSGSAAVPSGTSDVAVIATDPSGNTRTNTYQVTESGSTKTLTYDANGSLISDGTRTFEWDGANRLTAINQGTHRSEFAYDGWSHRVRIVEKNNGVVTSDRRLLWCGTTICEERDSSGANVTRRFFDQGVQESGTAFFYSKDHLESIRELSDAAGTLRARYDYDPYGRVTKLSGDKDSVFIFTGFLAHDPSGLALAPLRAYDPSFGRWISPDPIGLQGGLNVYAYAGGMPVDRRDPLGLLVTEAAATVVTGSNPVGAAIVGGAAGAAAMWWLWQKTGVPWPPWYAPPPADPQAEPQQKAKPSPPPQPQPDPQPQPQPKPQRDTEPKLQPPPPRSEECEPNTKDEDCEKEWAEAYETCEELFRKPHPPRGLTGGYKSLYDCARGHVSERCGGNVVE